MLDDGGAKEIGGLQVAKILLLFKIGARRGSKLVNVRFPAHGADKSDRQD